MSVSCIYRFELLLRSIESPIQPLLQAADKLIFLNRVSYSLGFGGLPAARGCALS